MSLLPPQTAPYPHPHPVTISIDGILLPEMHPTLLEGLAALWSAASVQLIWGPSYTATQRSLSAAWAPGIAAVLERDGRWTTDLVLRAGFGELSHPTVMICPGSPSGTAHRAKVPR